ncbi:MAG: hypothetical protein KGH72_02725 [Candidatus Micrarchaeota archaeon]|nr:hypothetical protein [Candidatus Micrarchaeota archaeon]
MICFVFSRKDQVSKNAAEYLIRERGMEEGRLKGGILLHESHERLVDAAGIDRLGASVAYFLSQHRSASGTSAFTVHSMGNWGDKAELGGKPRELSVASPVHMLAALKDLSLQKAGVEVTYEATHHGPLIATPAFFAEFGGGEQALGDVRMAEALAEACYSSAVSLIDGSYDAGRVAIGIGGNHYPSKFRALALERGYAFSHIMPRYAAAPEMLEQACERSNPKPDLAVIDRKGINSYSRELITGRLDEIGLEYEKI